MKKRIWELDALRGLCILGVVAVHLIYDMTELFCLFKLPENAFFEFLVQWGSVLFLLLSGISVTLGTRHIFRGLVVFGCGLMISGVTYAMYRLGFAGKELIIYFGVLHCLGACMLLWQVFRRLPVWLLPVLAAAAVGAGFWLLNNAAAHSYWLLPFGVKPWGFVTADYFPLLPNFGYFLLGAMLGRLLYRKKESLLPGVNTKNPVVAVLCRCGRNSLWIYLAHQPLLVGMLILITNISS